MTETLPHDPRARELRRTFDRSFWLPPPRLAEEAEDLLAIRVVGEPCALRLRDITGVVTDRRIVPVPGRYPDCLGVAGIRGTPVPVFDLAMLLGFTRRDESARWMVLSGREEPVALAFSEFDGYLRVPRSSIKSESNSPSTALQAGEIVQTPAGSRAIIAVSILVATVRSRAGAAQPAQEH